MELQSACTLFRTPPKFRSSINRHHLFSLKNVFARNVDFSNRIVRFVSSYKPLMCDFSLNGRVAIVCTSVTDSNSGSNSKLRPSRRENNGVSVSRSGDLEPFRGNSGSVSFRGLTYQSIEEGQLVSSPFKEGAGSFLWVLAPVAIISSLVIPQFFIGNVIDAFIKDEILAEILALLTSDAMFYIGLATFLRVTDTIQKPYLQFSSKRWGLITGLRGYLSSAFLTMGLKVLAPLFAVYVTWPVLGLSSLVAVTPFLVGCLVQFAFERRLEKRMSSSWPLVPIIFEVYRLYQLTKSAQFIEKTLMSMNGTPMSPALLEKSGALVGMLVTFQVLGLVGLWSLLTFLMRLFPSRPVAENY